MRPSYRHGAVRRQLTPAAPGSYSFPMEQAETSFSGMEHNTIPVPRRAFVSAAVAALLCSREAAAQDDDEETAEETIDPLRIAAVREAIVRMPDIAFEDFLKGVQIGEDRITLLRPEQHPAAIKTVQVNDRAWNLVGKSGLASLASSIVFKSIDWDADADELRIIVLARSRITRKEVAKAHDAEHAAELLARLIHGTQEIRLHNAEGKFTGAVLELAHEP